MNCKISIIKRIPSIRSISMFFLIVVVNILDRPKVVAWRATRCRSVMECALLCRLYAESVVSWHVGSLYPKLTCDNSTMQTRFHVARVVCRVARVNDNPKTFIKGISMLNYWILIYNLIYSFPCLSCSCILFYSFHN